MKNLLLLMAMGLLTAGLACAADGNLPSGCGQCGPCCAAQPVCRVVCETKKVKKTCWLVECEEFCIPLPQCGFWGLFGRKNATWCGECAETNCGEGRSGNACKPLVPPKCGKPRCRKKLVKKEIEYEVPVYKCVVDYCSNGDCGEWLPNLPAPEATPIAAPAAASEER